MDKNWAKSIALLTSITTILVGYVGVGTGLGYLLSTKLGAPSWCLILGSMVGLVLAMVQLVYLSEKQQGEVDQDMKNDD